MKMTKTHKYPTIKEVIQERVELYKLLNMPTLEQFSDSKSSKNKSLFEDYLEDFVKTSSGVIIKANGRGNKAKFVQHHPLLYKCFDHHYFQTEYNLAGEFEDYDIKRERDGAHLKEILIPSYKNIPIPVDYNSSEGIEFSLKSAEKQYQVHMWIFEFSKSKILNAEVWNAFVEGDKNLLRTYRDMVFEFSLDNTPFSYNDPPMCINIGFPSSNYEKFDTLWPIRIGGIEGSEIRV